MKYRVGQVVEGKVTGIQPYGAFVALDPHTSGLIHISEISDGYVRDISHFVKPGDVVRVKIIDIDAKNHQARLSLKALHHPHARSRRLMNQKPVLPPMRLGFSSIAMHMDQWVKEAQRKEEEYQHDEV